MSNWGQAPEQVGPVGGGNAGWLNLKEGTYRVRLVSGYAYIGYHFNPKTNKSTVCPNRAKGDDLCDQCRLLKDEKGKIYTQDQANATRTAFKQQTGKDMKFFYNRPSQKYVVNLLDLDDKDDNGVPKLKHCELPYKVVEQINNYAMNPSYSFRDLPSWDMTIVRTNGKTKTDVSWSVQADRDNRELSQAEMEAVDSAPTPEQIVNKKHTYAAKDAEENDPNNYASQDAMVENEGKGVTSQDVEEVFETEDDNQDGPGEPPAPRGGIDPELGF